MEKNKKKSVISNKNAFTLFVVIGVCALLFIVGLCNVLNRYFDNKEQRKTGVRPTFYADNLTEMDVVIPSSNENSEITSIDYKISLKSKSSAASVCKYNLYYYWDENPDGYYQSGNQDEITLSGTIDNRVIFDNIVLNDYNLGDLKTLLASYYIVNDGNEITNQTWHITSYFHSGDNSENIVNKTYPGKIGVEEVTCSGAKFLKDQDYRDDGTYICLNSNDEFCPKENLYEVISKDDEGIKVVRTKAFGISSWNNDLLPRLEEAFLASDGQYLSGMIVDHAWPLYDEANLDASFDIVKSHENETQNKVTSKVGLLSLSDFKFLKTLVDYNKPYLLLSNTGLVVNADGFIADTNTTGYVYPVLYLDNNAVISKGNGAWGNPYFVN